MNLQPWQKLLNHYECFMKIDLNIQWSLFAENKHNMVLLSGFWKYMGKAIDKSK